MLLQSTAAGSQLSSMDLEDATGRTDPLVNSGINTVAGYDGTDPEANDIAVVIGRTVRAVLGLGLAPHTAAECETVHPGKVMLLRYST